MKSVLLLLSFVLISACTSIKEFNKTLKTPINPEKLHQDIDFTEKKLEQLHPKLYWYISKDELHHQFDSLKTTITQPLTPAAFFDKLAPVIAKIREGHLTLTPPIERFTKKEQKRLENQKGLFGRMNYTVNNQRLFVKDNADKFEGIKVGTEIMEINGIPVQHYLEKYGRYVTGDGFNTTFKKYGLAQRWAIYFTAEKGILDSVLIKTRYLNQEKQLYIHREARTKEEKQEEKKVLAAVNKNEEQKNQDYNPITRSYNRDLQFLEKDSSVAYMKIKTFSGTRSARFYKESFKKLKDSKTKILILDVRDNLGGSLREVNNLYSYLVTKKFQFIDDIEVTEWTSTLHADYFTEFSPVMYPLAVLGYPFYALGTLASNKEKGGKVYLRNNSIFSIKNPKKNSFQGVIYLLMNGSSFSASAILASKLKNDHRATLVGEETGGANDGTVAGRYATQQLPQSKLYLPIGLMLIQPQIEPTHTQKGVLPDVEIISSLSDILGKKDPQLQWIKSDIEKR